MNSFAGLPLHPLVVHAVVVLVPLAAIFVGLAAVLPRFRAWAGWMPMLFAGAAMLSVPLATSSGESLQGKVVTQDPSPAHIALINDHVRMGEELNPWVIALFLASVAIWWLDRKSRNLPDLLLKSVPALAVVAAVGSIVFVGLIGHSGAKAAWHGVQNLPSAPGYGEGG